MKIAIGTKSEDKIKGVIEAFLDFYKIKADELEVFYQSVNSRVPDQPYNEEIYIGAKNRVQALKEIFKNERIDYYIACETGIEDFNGDYFNIQVVCVENKNGQQLMGKSSGWQIPTKAIEKIKQTDLDIYLRSLGINSIQDVLGEKFSRDKSVCEATKYALTSENLLRLSEKKTMDDQREENM